MRETLAYLTMALISAYYAMYLATPQGKAWIDANTTLGVVIGSSLILAGLGLVLDSSQWLKVVLAFGAVGAPMVARKALRG